MHRMSIISSFFKMKKYWDRKIKKDMNKRFLHFSCKSREPLVRELQLLSQKMRTWITLKSRWHYCTSYVQIPIFWDFPTRKVPSILQPATALLPSEYVVFSKFLSLGPVVHLFLSASQLLGSVFSFNSIHLVQLQIQTSPSRYPILGVHWPFADWRCQPRSI